MDMEPTADWHPKVKNLVCVVLANTCIFLGPLVSLVCCQRTELHTVALGAVAPHTVVWLRTGTCLSARRAAVCIGLQLRDVSTDRTDPITHAIVLCKLRSHHACKTCCASSDHITHAKRVVQVAITSHMQNVLCK
jgi:hypothetical protein